MPQNIFRISDDTELTLFELQKYIQKNDDIVSLLYKKLQNAYESDHDIFHQANKESYKPDNRIAVNFPKYLVDTMQGFFIGIPIKVSSDDPSVSAYIKLLDVYNDQDDQNSELAKICLIYGRGYEMYFVDEYGEIGITYLDPMESFMIYDESILQRPRYFVRTYKDSNDQRHGSVSNSRMIRYFDINPKLQWTDEKPHGFDGVPAVEYVANKERQGLFEPVMSMVNAYNKAISEKANDVDYFADAYLKILGALLDDGDIKTIRDDRIINLSGDEATNVVVEFMEKPNADTTQENLINRLEKLVFQISMIANINDEQFGTASGIALKYKLQSMSNLSKTLERKFTSGMNRRYKLIFSNPVSGMREDDWMSISYKFTRNFPSNELEESQIAGNLAGITSKRTQLSVLSVVEDVDAEIEALDEQENSFTLFPTDRVTDDDVLGETAEETE